MAMSKSAARPKTAVKSKTSQSKPPRDAVQKPLPRIVGPVNSVGNTLRDLLAACMRHLDQNQDAPTFSGFSSFITILNSLDYVLATGSVHTGRSESYNFSAATINMESEGVISEHERQWAAYALAEAFVHQAEDREYLFEHITEANKNNSRVNSHFTVMTPLSNMLLQSINADYFTTVLTDEPTEDQLHRAIKVIHGALSGVHDTHFMVDMCEHEDSDPSVNYQYWVMDAWEQGLISAVDAYALSLYLQPVLSAHLENNLYVDGEDNFLDAMVHAAEQMTPVQVSVLAGTIRVKLEQREADFSLTEFLDCLEKNDALPPRMMAPLVGGQVLNFDSFDVSLELIAERLAAYQSLVR